ncbi:hypothetical protein GCM10010278_27390 [Streptomyces melanogenes]|nr:hypothetical protein GCM10010278_27390 [Streptomyces melanogenes]
MPGPQVEAPISHLTALRGGGSSGQTAAIVPYGRWSRPMCAPRLTAAVLRLSMEPRLCPDGAFFMCHGGWSE